MRASASRLPIRVLSREEEAHYGYLAAVNSTTLSDGCVLDLGGGSMQLVRVRGRAALESGSWRLGTVRMSERFLPPNGPAKRRQLGELREYIAAELERHRLAARRFAPGPGGSSASAARCETSPRPPSARRACPPTACRGW